MYRMTRPTYWGPAQHDAAHPLHPTGAPFDPLDLRDEASDRPDDN
ncbi:hypothetical protein GCM10027076_32700 [Nocardioides montaniterrae]